MEDTAIVIMLKNKETGFLETEIGSYAIAQNDELIYNIFAVKEDDGIKVHMRITVDKELEDWEFSAVFDYYDTEVFLGLCEIVEDDSGYNPVWEMIFDFEEREEAVEEKISEILSVHLAELKSVYEAIEGLEGEYS